MPHKEQSDNEVGYRRPPVAHQFKKGQSGNPKGRRKGSVSAVSHVANALNEFVVVQEKGERRSFSKLAVAAKQLVNKAVSGDLRAWKCLLEMIGESCVEEYERNNAAERRRDFGARDYYATISTDPRENGRSRQPRKFTVDPVAIATSVGIVTFAKNRRFPSRIGSATGVLTQ